MTIDGRVEAVSQLQLRALRVLAESRDGVSAGDGIGQLHDSDRKSLENLAKQKPHTWGEVIVFPKGKGKGGYRLL